MEILCKACENGRIKTEPELDMIDSGIFDSLALIEFIDGIYDEFGVEISVTEIRPELWHNAYKLCECISEMIKK